MKIKRLEIKGYKSIGHLVLEDVPSLMVLAGANGAGKSNLVEALAFFSAILQKGLQITVNDFGGWKDIVPKIKNIQPKSKHDMFFDFHIHIRNELYHYSLELEITKNSAVIKYETLHQNNEEIFTRESIPKHPPIPTIKREQIDNNDIVASMVAGGIIGAMASKNIGGALIGGILGAAITSQANDGNQSKSKVNLSDELSLLQTTFSTTDLYNFLAYIKIFKIDPFVAKYPSRDINNSDELNPNGNNIAAVLAKLEKDDDFRETLMEWLELIVPQMQEINASANRLDGSVGLSFTEASGKQFPAHLISDGTLYVICILTAILSRYNEYGITIIEEPERGIHPKAIGELIGFIRDKMAESGKHTVILTTHSESVVRNSEVEELFFVQQENGATQVKSLRGSSVDKNKIPLDTAWLTNILGGGSPW